MTKFEKSVVRVLRDHGPMTKVILEQYLELEGFWLVRPRLTITIKDLKEMSLVRDTGPSFVEYFSLTEVARLH